MPLSERTVTSELSNDYTLPDYQPEIRRLLYIGSTVLPPAKYVGGGNVELDGTVDYQILYIGGDGELHTAPLSASYGVHVPMENPSAFDLNEGVSVFANVQAENLTARVSAPRKLTVRCRMRSSVTAYANMPMGEKSSGTVDPASLCRLEKETKCADWASGRSEILELSEELPLHDPELRVIGANGAVHVQETSCREGEIVARGEIFLKVLYTVGGDLPQTEVRKIPFEGTVEFEDASHNMASCAVTGCVSEIALEVEENAVLCRIQMILEARTGCNESIPYTADLYSTENPCRTQYADFEVPVVLPAVNGNLSQSERLSASEKGIPDGARVVDVYPVASIDHCEAKDGKYIFTGQSRYVLICEKDGEYSATEILLPLRYEADGCDLPLKNADAHATVVSCRAAVNGSTLELDGELSISASMTGSEPIRVLSEAEFSPAQAKTSRDLVLCYPSPDDSVWSVAKRYMVTPDRISGDPATDAYLVIQGA